MESYNGVGEIKTHDFFANTNWHTLAVTTPPFEPELEDDEDCGYFEAATKEGIEGSDQVRCSRLLTVYLQTCESTPSLRTRTPPSRAIRGPMGGIGVTKRECLFELPRVERGARPASLRPGLF